MSKGFKKSVAFLFFLLAGITIGSVIAYLAKDIPVLSWLAYSKTVGLATGSPAVIDLIVIKIAIGFELTASVAQILCIIISIIVFGKTCKNL